MWVIMVNVASYGENTTFNKCIGGWFSQTFSVVWLKLGARRRKWSAQEKGHSMIRLSFFLNLPFCLWVLHLSLSLSILWVGQFVIVLHHIQFEAIVCHYIFWNSLVLRTRGFFFFFFPSSIVFFIIVLNCIGWLICSCLASHLICNYQVSLHFLEQGCL